MAVERTVSSRQVWSFVDLFSRDPEGSASAALGFAAKRQRQR